MTSVKSKTSTTGAPGVNVATSTASVSKASSQQVPVAAEVTTKSHYEAGTVSGTGTGEPPLKKVLAAVQAVDPEAPIIEVVPQSPLAMAGVDAGVILSAGGRPLQSASLEQLCPLDTPVDLELATPTGLRAFRVTRTQDGVIERWKAQPLAPRGVFFSAKTEVAGLVLPSGLRANSATVYSHRDLAARRGETSSLRNGDDLQAIVTSAPVGAHLILADRSSGLSWAFNHDPDGWTLHSTTGKRATPSQQVQGAEASIKTLRDDMTFLGAKIERTGNALRVMSVPDFSLAQVAHLKVGSTVGTSLLNSPATQADRAVLAQRSTALGIMPDSEGARRGLPVGGLVLGGQDARGATLAVTKDSELNQPGLKTVSVLTAQGMSTYNVGAKFTRVDLPCVMLSDAGGYSTLQSLLKAGLPYGASIDGFLKLDSTSAPKTPVSHAAAAGFDAPEAVEAVSALLDSAQKTQRALDQLRHAVRGAPPAELKQALDRFWDDHYQAIKDNPATSDDAYQASLEEQFDATLESVERYRLVADNMRKTFAQAEKEHWSSRDLSQTVDALWAAESFADWERLPLDELRTNLRDAVATRGKSEYDEGGSELPEVTRDELQAQLDVVRDIVAKADQLEADVENGADVGKSIDRLNRLLGSYSDRDPVQAVRSALEPPRAQTERAQADPEQCLDFSFKAADATVEAMEGLERRTDVPAQTKLNWMREAWAKYLEFHGLMTEGVDVENLKQWTDEYASDFRERLAALPVAAPTGKGPKSPALQRVTSPGAQPEPITDLASLEHVLEQLKPGDTFSLSSSEAAQNWQLVVTDNGRFKVASWSYSAAKVPSER